MSGRMARNKGKRGEREIVNLLQPVVDRVCEELAVERIVVGRNLRQSREGGCDIDGLEWMSLEVKRQERLAVDVWWRQTLRQANDSWPVCGWRASRSSWTFRTIVPLFPHPKSKKFVRATVDIDLPTFLLLFELKLRAHLTGEL